MKKATLLILCISCAFVVNAQGKRTIKDSFESNRFQWEEYYEKTCSASIQDGYLELKNQDITKPAWSVVEFPIDIDRNFDLSFVFEADIKNDYWFGIIFNYEDENNYSCFVVQEKRFRLINYVKGVRSVSRRNEIILKKGRDKEVKIEMGKKGRKLFFVVDEMEVITVTKDLQSNVFGCIVDGYNSIKLTEVVMEQMNND